MGLLFGFVMFIALFAMLLLGGLFITLALATGGLIALFFFSDFIVCVIIIIVLIKKLVNRRKK